MAETLCRLKERIRFGRGSQWSPAFCKQIADGMTSAAETHALSPALLLAVAVNESDLDEGAVLEDSRGEQIFAKDGGLMGIRCVVDKRGRCTNGHVRGMTLKEVMDPLTNIQLGAAMLAHYREDGGISRVERRRRGRDGKLKNVVTSTRCRHASHAYWAHYNHGPLYKSTGPARHYPHRIAVLYHAAARALNLPVPDELQSQNLTVKDPGKRVRTADRPVEHRYQELVDHILAAGACQNIALLTPAARN